MARGERVNIDLGEDVFRTQVAGLERNFPIFEIAPGVEIAIVNILGDTELIEAAGALLSEKLSPIIEAESQRPVLVTAEAKS